MNVARETIIDLLPLYLSGEASAQTQALVAEHLARDAELAALAREQQAALGAIASPPGSPDLETISFRRTRGRIVAQRWSFGLAWLFTAVSLSTEVHIENGHITGARLALIDAPLLLGLTSAIAVICWLSYANLRR